MIRVRDSNGQAHVVTAGKAVEFLDERGRLAAVVLTRGPSSCKIATKGDPEFNAYCKQTGLQPSTIHVHHPRELKDVQTGR